MAEHIVVPEDVPDDWQPPGYVHQEDLTPVTDTFGHQGTNMKHSHA